jgi:hypothetical protein
MGSGDFFESDSQLSAFEFIEDAFREAKQGARKVNELKEEMRNSCDGFYVKRKAKEGIKAAEDELAEVIRKRKYLEVTTTAAGIIFCAGELAKLKIKDPLIRLVSDPESLPLARMTMRARGDRAHKVLVITNRTPDFIVCNTLRNAEIWSPSGTLGLREIGKSVV